ncbi:MAG: M14 family metallocarboxypeptidase [bacterium]|nr:M14 family metallocarboxypeptidase [bacterium]
MESIISPIEHDYNSCRKIINRLVEKYPFLKSKVIGRSIGGRDITALKLGESTEYVLYAGAFHGSERITRVLLLKFLEELCFCIKNNISISGINANRGMFGRGLIVVPCVNPDGCEITLKGESCCGNYGPMVKKLSGGDYGHWNANLRGVDINHNFSAGWQELHRRELEMGIFGPAPRQYGGTRPESEPETAAMVKLCQDVKFRYVLAFHSQGEVIYWNWNQYEIPHAKRMAEIMATSSGYALDVPIGLALGGGFKDWFIERYRRPGFTIEVGKGENPLDMGCLGGIYRQIKEMMVLSLLM